MLPLPSRVVSLVVATVFVSRPALAEETPSPAGRLFAAGSLYENGKLKAAGVVTINPETGAWRQLVPTHVTSFAVTPDGQTIVYAQDGALWSGDAFENANPGKVCSEVGDIVFSPDSRLMFVSVVKKKPQTAGGSTAWEKTVFKMGLVGSSPMTMHEMAGSRVLDWCPDGESLLVEADQVIKLVRLQGGEESKQLVKGPYYRRATFSPNGRRVAYTHEWNGTIRLVDLETGDDKLFFQAPNHTGIGNSLRWSPDGKRLAVVMLDQTFRDGKKGIHIDPQITHQRIELFDVATGEHRRLELPRQDGLDFYPHPLSDYLDWR